MSSEFICGLHPATALSNAAYHALDAVGKSDLDRIARSPLHWKYAEREETPAMRIGSAVHCAVLEPERYATDYVTAPSCERRTKAGKEEWTAFEEAHAGKVILTAAESAQCISMSTTMRAHPLVRDYLTAGEAEVSALWVDSEFGVNCRARFDWLSASGMALYLKTTGDASPAAFAKTCANFRYHVQAAWYLDALKMVTGNAPGRVPLRGDREGRAIRGGGVRARRGGYRVWALSCAARSITLRLRERPELVAWIFRNDSVHFTAPLGIRSASGGIVVNYPALKGGACECRARLTRVSGLGRYVSNRSLRPTPECFFSSGYWKDGIM